MEHSKEAIAVRIMRLNRQILGKVTGASKVLKKNIDREALLDALTALYDECNEDPIKKSDELVRLFLDKYRSTMAELRRTRVCISDFDIVETIGRGHFGEVHMVREKQTCDVYALKTLRKEQARKRASGAAEDERDVLAMANNPWMPKLQYAFQDSNNLYLVMELCSGGDLAGLLSRRHNPLSERDAAFYVAEIAHALKALHGMGYVHRDVKPHNILLDRCGHIKLGDFGSCARLSDGNLTTVPVGTADYVAPELLAAAECAAKHTVCQPYCRGIATNAITACDYWSLGVVAFELVTLQRPFSSSDEDSIPKILSNIQKYERQERPEPPFPQHLPPSDEWRSLVTGLLNTQPSKRYNYLDTLQHPALQRLMHSIRDQAPPWVPCNRGPEDATYFSPPTRDPPAPSAASFRARAPFAGQLPFVGFSYVAPEENEESSSGFSSIHDSTAIDLASYKSAEKLAAMRAREIASLQSKLAACEASASAAVDKARRAAEDEAERQRARLQAEITALSLQNKRLERQIEVEKEERMALERTNQELNAGVSERNSAEVRNAQAKAKALQRERDALQEDIRRLESRISELQAEFANAVAAADNAKAQQKHYKDTIAKERALRRQTLSGGEQETREAGARAAAAEANSAKETRLREQVEKKLAACEAENATLKAELEEARRDLTNIQASVGEKQRLASASTDQLNEIQLQLTQERLRATTLQQQVKELKKTVEESQLREQAIEEQCSRTETRLNAQVDAAEARAAAALAEDSRHREKVQKLEQLVRQLEREVSGLETRACLRCTERNEHGAGDAGHNDAISDTESVGVGDHVQAQVLREQLERAEAQLQARADEIASLKQETRTANLARWRKEREYNEIQLELKSTTRDLKRVEEKLATVTEVKNTAQKKVTELKTELDALKPLYERTKREAERTKEELDKIKKTQETLQAEVDRSRNDIRKLKSELQYSEKRRMHAEEQEELSSRERAQLRDEVTELRAHNNFLIQNNKTLQEACSLLEEQLNDLEKLSDMTENKNKELDDETQRLRTELITLRSRLSEAEKISSERIAAANIAAQQQDEAKEQARHASCQIQLLSERLENREIEVSELETQVASLEGEKCATEAALHSALRRIRELQEECSSLRTRAHDHHAHALSLQAQLADAHEEIESMRETAEAAAAWWRTRETKADATLRQQAKLIDFLQAKVEEAGRKKCSLSNKLFGKSGRRNQSSPPLIRVNRELREEVDRLRAKLAKLNGSATPLSTHSYTDTPRRFRPTPTTPLVNRHMKSIDTPDGSERRDTGLHVVWSDGNREKMKARCSDGIIVLSSPNKEVRGRLMSLDASSLPQNEANRAFTIKLEKSDRQCSVVCPNVTERAQWVSQLRQTPSKAVYEPEKLITLKTEPNAALYVDQSAVAIGCTNGLISLRGEIQFEWDSDTSPPRHTDAHNITSIASVNGRCLMICDKTLIHTGKMALESNLRRSTNLKPTISVRKVCLPDSHPYLIKTLLRDTESACAAVACGRRVFVLRYDASHTEFKIARSVTVDRAPPSLLLTMKTLYIAGEKPLKINLPSGALETFATDEPVVAAAAKKHSPPKAILLIRHDPIEILICYAEYGLFVGENGKRTRNDDIKWSTAVQQWEFVYPFLYAVGTDRVSITYICDDAFRAPPCTCDNHSLASSGSESFVPQVFNLKLREPYLLGSNADGVIIRCKTNDGYKVSIVNGLAAFRSIGASVESLETVTDSVKGSSTDLAQSTTDLAQSEADIPQGHSNLHDISTESIQPNTGFLADIRKRARQLRAKNLKEEFKISREDVIKQILTTEVGLKRNVSNGRRSPAASLSEFSSESDTENEENTTSTKRTEDVCGEMFARQVRFQ